MKHKCVHENVYNTLLICDSRYNEYCQQKLLCFNIMSEVLKIINGFCIVKFNEMCTVSHEFVVGSCFFGYVFLFFLDCNRCCIMKAFSQKTINN